MEWKVIDVNFSRLSTLFNVLVSPQPMGKSHSNGA
jgi:hypothetical protein